MKRKISVTTGTRAEYGLLRTVLKEIVKSKKLDLSLIVSGMHLSKEHGLSINEIKKDGFKVYSKVDMIPKGNSGFDMSISVGVGILQFSKLFKKLKPDINLVLGDRDEVLASSIAAYHMNIPNAHIHGGDISGAGIDEYNRHAITKISNIHFPATEKSKNRIIKMGENPKTVFLTGSPSIDEITKNQISNKQTLEKKYGIKFSNNIILLVQHPVTSSSQQTEKYIKNILKAIVKEQKTTIAIAPNSDAGNKIIFSYLKEYSKKYNFIKYYPTIPRVDYLGMLKNCKLLLGNSSSGIIEGSYFDIPIIQIGIRQHNRETGKNIIVSTGYSTENISSAIKKALRIKKLKNKKKIYGNGKSSKKIVRVLENISLNNKLINNKMFY
jgi:UDP-N-acetylglucosamine 2-epimerase (non-hydrolysing)/GDP/UDP-N,N'-diacetylbacillosamine 2-epimerase (hydrolysing)